MSSVRGVETPLEVGHIYRATALSSTYVRFLETAESGQKWHHLPLSYCDNVTRRHSDIVFGPAHARSIHMRSQACA